MSQAKEFIVQQAINRAWSNPRSDFPYTFKPVQLSKKGGNIHTLRLPYVNIRLPDQTSRWAVYEMGQFGLWYLNINDPQYGWRTVNDLINNDDMLIQVFVNNRLLDLGSLRFMRNENQNNLIAIDYSKNKELLDSDDDLYIRFYSNSWFNTAAGLATNGLTWQGRSISVAQDAADMVNAITALSAPNPKQLMVYHNGYLIENLLVGEQNIGDSVQLYKDESIIDYFDIPFITMESFNSTRDSRRKVLVSIPDSIATRAAFVDDIEIYVCDTEKNLASVDRTVGVLYSRIDETNIRQLTLKDYAVDALRIEQIIGEHRDRLDRTTSFLRVYVRNATSLPALPDDGQMLSELYLLPSARRKDLMVGGAQGLPEWKAPALEDSAYMKWLQGDGDYVNENNVKGVFSYHGITNLVELPIKNATSNFTLPLSMQKGGIVFSYDSDGLLHGTTTVAPNTISFTGPLGTEHIECVPGIRAISGNNIEALSTMSSDPVSLVYESRWFRFNGGEWTFAKKGDHYDISSDGTRIEWDPTLASAERIRRLGNVYYHRLFTVTEDEMGTGINIFDGSIPYVDRPMAQMNLWINNRRLVENIDFVIIGNKVWLTSRGYYTPGNPINVEMCYHGAVTDYSQAPSYGSIKYRYLNYDAPYKLDAYRPNQIVINGYVAEKDKVDFSEIRNGGLAAAFRDGHMYGIIPTVNHLSKQDIDDLTFDAYEAKTKDTTLENFLSSEISEPKFTAPLFIPGKHDVISSLMTRLITEIDANRLDVSFGPTSDAAIAIILGEYKEDQDADVYLRENLDLDFFEIHPNGRNTTTVVTGTEFNFLNKINQDMFEGSINLTNYLTIS